MTPETLRTTLNLADSKRQAQHWQDAIALYRQLEAQLVGQGVFHHNLALCLLGAGQAAEALAQAERALAARPVLWQSAVVQARALKAMGRWPEAMQQLQGLALQEPQRGEFALELATLALHELCDAHLARQLVQPWLQHPVHGTDAALTDLMASLYEPTRCQGQRRDSAHEIHARALQFARQHLQPFDQLTARRAAPRPAPHRRLRVGLLSPLFNASPVYFFCSGALALLKDDFELVFFSRSRRADWATRELRAMAAQWVDTADLPADALYGVLSQHALDVLVDLGGWMDPVGLQALAAKPATRMYKWVGGQSLSTGLNNFDGFLTDVAQTPAGAEAWFTEPLLRLPHGYVSYSPPPYLPAPAPAPLDAHVLGIVANPVKVSRPFLAALAQHIADNTLGATQPGLPLVLRFIDRRYQYPAVQTRISHALQDARAQRSPAGRPVALEFIAPASHADYLHAVGGLSEMLDTFPYAGGLTTIEALSLGVPCRRLLAPDHGELFCERHTLAHLHYLSAPGSVRQSLPSARAGAPRQSLLVPGCPRSDHVALAASLSQLFTHGALQEAA